MKRISERSSARPGLHDFLHVMRKSLWILLLGVLALGLLIPFSTAALSGSSIFNLEVTHDQMKFRLFQTGAVPAILAVLAVLGLVSGIQMFRFVLSKKETTICFSLGITRVRLYLNRLTAGLLLLAAASAIPLALSCWLNAEALGVYDGLYRNTVYLFLGMWLMSAVSFLLTAVAIFAAGTLRESLVYWSGLMLLPTIVLYGANLLTKTLSWGSAWGKTAYSGAEIKASLLTLGAAWNPILFLKSPLETNGQFIRPLDTAVPDPVDWMLLLGWGIAVLLLALLALLLFRRRKAERAGMADANPVLGEGMVLLSGFLAFAEVLSLLFSESAWMAVLLGALAVLLLHLLWRRAFPAVPRRRCFGSLGAQCVLLCVLCLAAAAMPARTESFLQTAEIAEARVSYVGAPQWLYTEMEGSTTGRGYYVSGELTLSSDEALTLVRDLQMELIDAGRQEPGTYGAAADTVVPYDLCFSYTDFSGKEHTYYYDSCSCALLEEMLALEDTEEVRAAQAPLFDGTSESLAGYAYTFSGVYLTDIWLCNTYELTLSEEKRQELLDALASDLAEMPLEERYFPQTQARAVLFFTDSGQEDCRYYTYHLNNCYLYVTDAWEHTLSWLTENDLLGLVSNAPEIESIVLQRFDPYVGINGLSYPMGMYFMAYCADTSDEFLIQKDFGKQYKFTDADRIAEIAAGLQPGCYMTRGGFLAAVQLRGEEKLRYLFLPEAQVPEFVAG